jgi:hypothetical protein
VEGRHHDAFLFEQALAASGVAHCTTKIPNNPSIGYPSTGRVAEVASDDAVPASTTVPRTIDLPLVEETEPELDAKLGSLGGQTKILHIRSRIFGR